MGNTQSDNNKQNNNKQNDNKKKTLPQIIDYVASKYILTQNFKDMERLADVNYCDKLAILVSKVIEKNMSNLEIKFLSQRMKQGVEINEMNKDKLMFFKKDKLNNLDVINKTQKRRLCIGIAKFYVKISHIFSAIVTTVNPIYKFKDQEGNVQEVDLTQKHEIPDDVKANISRINICSQRLNALLNGETYADKDKKTTVKINPAFCNMNTDSTTSEPKLKTLFSEPGIPELEKLYFDNYDYDNGGFVGMTKNMRENVYEKDVELFYKIFSGNNEMPLINGKNKYKTFSQIPLKDYKIIEGCEPNGIYTKEYTGTLKEVLFSKYAQNINVMMNKTKASHNKLLAYIDQMFQFDMNPQTKKAEIIINVSLTESKLEKIVEEVRKIIIELYKNCEIDFLNGLKIFEDIVLKTIKDTSLQQDKNLEEIKQDLLTSSSSPPSESAVTEQTAAEQTAAEPAIVPDAAEPATAEPATAEPATAEPAVVPDAAEPATVEQAPAVVPDIVPDVVVPTTEPVVAPDAFVPAAAMSADEETTVL